MGKKTRSGMVAWEVLAMLEDEEGLQGSYSWTMEHQRTEPLMFQAVSYITGFSPEGFD